MAPSGAARTSARGKRATIHDVARAAGVAASTVSRAFSQPDRLRADTLDHVLAVSAELDYRPNPIARALPRGKTLTLALLVPDITNPFFFGLIRGAGRQADAAGYTLVLADTRESPDVEWKHLERLARGVDGFILASSRLPDSRLRALATDRSLVVINRTLPEAPCVVVDNRQGMRQAGEHLASLGHRRVAYLSGPPTSWSDRSRWRALHAASRTLGLDVPRLGPFAPTVESGAAAADAALVSGVTAVVAFNDLLAIGTMRRLLGRGVAVPDDMSVMGCDDIFGADFCHPPLTTLAADIESAGRAAVDLLLTPRGDNDPAPRPVVLPTQLRVRASTGTCPTERRSPSAAATHPATPSARGNR